MIQRIVTTVRYAANLKSAILRQSVTTVTTHAVSETDERANGIQIVAECLNSLHVALISLLEFWTTNKVSGYRVTSHRSADDVALNCG